MRITDIKELLEIYEDRDVYSERGLEEWNEDDMISASEHGFMTGYLAA